MGKTPQKRIFHTEYQELELASLSPTLKAVYLSAVEAGKRAYAPYSGFRVGAAVLLDNGEIIQGNNQENSAYPSGLCAERVALFAAKAKYPEADVNAIAVTAQSELAEKLSQPVTPCGSCRQVMSEYESLNQAGDIEVILGGSGDTIWLLPNASCLLPLTFRGEGVRKEGNQ